MPSATSQPAAAQQAQGAHSMPSYPHLAWAAGHALVVLTSIWTAFRLATFSVPSGKLISLAYCGALVSWGVVVYKTLGTPAVNKTYVNRFLTDENGEYLLLAFYWFVNAPIYITLFPFAVFSLFHTLTFVRTTFLPPPPKSAAGQPAPHTASRQIQSFVKKNYERAMELVASAEVFIIFPYLVLTAIVRRNPLHAPLMFAHFLRLRYTLSAQTRKAVASLNAHFDQLVSHPSFPAAIRPAVQTARNFIAQYMSSVVPGASTTGGATPTAAAQAQAQARAAQ